MAVAVTTFVALVGISDSFKKSAMAVYDAVGTDLVVVRAGGQERLNSALEHKLAGKLAQLPGVSEVAATLTDVISLEEYDVYAAGIQGFEPGSPLFGKLGIYEGHSLESGDQGKVLLGSILAANLGMSVGDEIVIYEDETFQVAGLYKSYNVLLDGVMVMLLEDLQRLMDRPGQVTGFGLTVDDPTNLAAIERTKQAVVDLDKSLKVMSVKDHVETLTQFQITQAMAWITAAIAVVIGAISVLNTMFVSVLDRRHEIGILRAIGWRRGRVVRMVLWESVAMSVGAAMAGSLVAVGLVRFLTRVSLVNGVIDGNVSWYIIAEGFLLAMVVGLVGAAYPAYRSACLRPTEALRHE
jgi:putative ABC transport system permease protein